MSHESSHEVPPAAGQLWRRVRCKDQTTYDNNLGRIRPSSNIFKDGTDALGDPDPVSAFRADACGSPNIALAGYEETHGLIMISEETMTTLGLQVVDRPNENGPPGHVLLVGRKTGAMRSQLAKDAIWVVPCPE